MVSSTAHSPVAAAMLNPALLATVTAAAAVTYEENAGTPMPASLAFLVAPLVLHRGTREALPTKTSTHWATWLGRNEVLRAGVPARARSLVGPVREGLRFGLAHGVLTLDGDAGLSGHLASRRPDTVGDLPDLVRAAGLVGRWLTRLDRPATAYALLGVAP